MTPDATDIAIREGTDITRADPEQAAAALQHILATGDLSKLTNQQRVATNLHLCASIGLNPISRPFDWLLLDGKLVLYPNKSCAEQLRRIHQISVKVTRFEVIGNNTKEPMVVVTVEGRRPNGQTDESTKYVSLMGWNNKRQESYRLSGKELANAYAKAETSAKRRLTLSMIGLAMPPEDMEHARRVIVDGTGRIIDNPTDMDRALADDPRLAKQLGEPTYETTATPSESPFAGAASQAPTLDELTPPTRPYQPPARFHCDKQRWLGVWHMLVRGTFLADDDARHDFVGWYTSPWPENRQTSSLSTFLDRATDRQAEALINRARETLADRASFAPAATEDAAPTEYDAPVSVTIDERDAVEYPDRPLDGVEYSTAALRSFYAAWADALRHRDTGFRPIPDNALMRSTKEQLLHEIGSLIGQVESVDNFLAMVDDEGADSDDESMAPTDSELPF